MLKRACCQDERNLSAPQVLEGRGETVRVCQVCGAKHYECEAPPIVFALRGK